MDANCFIYSVEHIEPYCTLLEPVWRRGGILTTLGDPMPEICRFYGIVIRMYLIDREHPPPHIHIKYGDHQAVMELENLNLIDGHLPRKCRQLVREWAELHQDELTDMWKTQHFHPIQPLE